MLVCKSWTLLIIWKQMLLSFRAGIATVNFVFSVVINYNIFCNTGGLMTSDGSNDKLEEGYTQWYYFSIIFVFKHLSLDLRTNQVEPGGMNNDKEAKKLQLESSKENVLTDNGKNRFLVLNLTLRGWSLKHCIQIVGLWGMQHISVL